MSVVISRPSSGQIIKKRSVDDSSHDLWLGGQMLCTGPLDQGNDLALHRDCFFSFGVRYLRNYQETGFVEQGLLAKRQLFFMAEVG